MRTVLEMCHGLPERRVEPGQVLLAEGGADKVLYILIDGELEVIKRGTQVNTQSDPGTIFGELAVLLDIPHTAMVRAVKPSRLYVAEDADRFLQSHPDLSYQLAKLLALKLNSITTYLVDLKNQFQDQDDHLGMVDEVLEALLTQPVEEHTAGSDRYPDPTI